MTHWLLCNCTFAKVALNIKTWSPVFPIFCGAKKGIIECSLLAGVFLALLPRTLQSGPAFVAKEQKHCLMATDSSCLLHSCSDLPLAQNTVWRLYFYLWVIETRVKPHRAGWVCV